MAQLCQSAQPREPAPPLAPGRSQLWAGLPRALSLTLLLLLLMLTAAPLPARASLFHLEGPEPADLGLRDGHLAPCASPAHCVRQDWPVADPIAALSQLLPAVLALEGVELVESGPAYLHATARSRLFGFVDDLEVHADSAASLIEARSASRLGDSDLGVNGRRLSRLRGSLQALAGSGG